MRQAGPVNRDHVTTAGNSLGGTALVAQGLEDLIHAIPDGELVGLLLGALKVLGGLGLIVSGYFTNKPAP